jgi:hypothetical protein
MSASIGSVAQLQPGLGRCGRWTSVLRSEAAGRLCRFARLAGTRL